jgi:hypothetical protein
MADSISPSQDKKAIQLLNKWLNEVEKLILTLGLLTHG